MRRLSPRAVLAAGWLVAFIYGYPGRLPRTSVDLLQHARAPHPTVFSFVWHLVEYAVAGPTGMLVAQVTLAVAGVYAILKAALPDERAAWLTAAVIVSPPVLATLTIVSPASLAGALLLFGAGSGSTVALGAAAAIHPAAILAVLPLLLLREAPARAVLVWLAIAAIAIGANAALTRRAPQFHAHTAALRAPATIDPPTAPDDVLLKLGVPTERSHLQDAITAVLDLVPLLYAPWLWLAAALGVLAVRRDGSSRRMVAAGIAFAAGLAVTPPDHALPLYAFVLVILFRGDAAMDAIREKRA
jgi:hypothetical protein